MEQLTLRPTIWDILCQDAAGLEDIPVDTADDIFSICEPASGPGTGAETTMSSPIYPSSTCGDSRSLDGEPPSSTLRHSRSFLQMEVHETFTYTYNLSIGDTHLQVLILVESEQESNRLNHYVFSLSVKIGRVERTISKPVTMKLTVDPGGLDFVVFAFVPRSSLPAGCLYHLRVWLRSAGVDHRVFGEKDLWFGRDPDFRAITDASFASLRKTTKDTLIYQCTVGRAHVSFILRWTAIEPHVYALALDYEAGGVGKTLFEDYRLRLDCEPHTLSFLIYSIPVPSTPVGASHRLRVWLRIPVDDTASHLYQRLWKSDDFKIGAHLRFDSESHTFIVATRATDDPVASSGSLSHHLGLGLGLGLGLSLGLNPNAFSGVPLVPNRRQMPRLVPGVDMDEAGEPVHDQ